MKTKRILFIASLICMFGICFTIMNKHYDELARYQYVTKENREILLAHLSTDDINYIVAQQIKPEQFLPFIEAKGFSVRNCMWYSKAKEIQDADHQLIVSFINDFKDKLEYSNLDTLLSSYSYQTLRTFYEEDNDYVKNATVVANPSSLYTLIKESESLYTYVPKDLVEIRELPHVSLVGDSDILIKSEVMEPLQSMCNDLSLLNDKTCGNLIITAGYISYEKQIPLYEKMMLKYGKDEFSKYWDYPGQNEFQLGYSIRFQIAGKEENVVDEFSIAQKQEAENGDETKTEVDNSVEEELQLATWIKENAYKYGFILRYPENQEKSTGKLYQPFTLRYIGKDIAKELHESGKTLEEYKVTVK